jgi:PAS domain S-box-containing protein
MKKYLIVLAIFLVSLGFIGSNLMRNVQISEEMQSYENLKQLSYEMNLLLKDQENTIHHLDTVGTDKLLKFHDKINKLSIHFVEILKKHEDKKFVKIADRIDKKLVNLQELYKNLQQNPSLDIEAFEKELTKYSVSVEVEAVILEALKNIHLLNKEISSIIQILVGSSLFLLFFGVIIYIREILHTRELGMLKNELQQFVDALDATSIVSKTDTEGRITFINNEFCRVSGYTSEELIGQAHNIIRHPDMDRAVFKEMWTTIRAGKIFRGIIKNRKKNGEAYYVDSAIIPIMDIDKDIVEYLAIRYDVTEVVISRDKALLAEKSKDEFLSKMSHELRTPLNSIVGFSDILKRVIKDEKQLKYLKNITESSASLLSIINDILDLSKLNSGSFSLDYHEFEAYTNVESLLQRFEAQATAAGIIIKVDIDESLHLNLVGDWLRISQIITNFVSNALKFTPKGSEVFFKASYENNSLFLSVKDSGIGISKEAQEKIFKPFEQADSSTTRRYGGTGLGLSIVTSLVKQMRGELTLESEPNIGSEFKVRLPLEAKVHKQVLVLEHEEIGEHKALKGHVLIAEDNKTNQMLIGLLVEEFGLTSKIVGDGVEAVSAFNKEKFDLILMDENMPKLNGVHAMEKIRHLKGGGLPIIALTANAMKGDREKFLKAGMDEFVAKPIERDELYRILKSFLVRKNA